MSGTKKQGRAVPAAAGALIAVALLAGCTAGLLDSERTEPVAYQLRAASAPPLAPTVAADLVVLRPLARPGLESDAITVWLPDRRLDAYADSRWSAPLPDLVQSLLLDELRSRAAFARAFPDRGQFRGRYWLQTEIRDFQAEYATEGEAPRVRVTLRADLGRAGDRGVLGSAVGEAEVRAAGNRLRDVTAAFEAAYAQAADAIVRGIHGAALAAEREAPAAGANPPDERVPTPRTPDRTKAP